MNKVLIVLAALGSVPAISGCSDSGVNAPTTVVVKPNATPSAAAPAETKEGPTGAGPAAGGFGTFKGRVVLQGAAPQLQLLVAKGANIKDAAVCAAQDVPNEKLVVGPDGGVANVFVYLSKAPAGAKKTDPPKEPVVFDQKGCRFIPHALVIRVGQPMQITSHDNVAHNTSIKTTRGSGFNAIIPANDTVGKTMAFQTFENSPAPVNCDFHGWMSARQLPLDHPFAAVTNEKGEFEIRDLPSGTHRFSVWHEGAEFLNRGNLVVTVKPDETVEQEVPYPIAKFKP